MWVELADYVVVKVTGEALESRGVNVEYFNNKEAALKRLTNFILSGADVMTGSSTTLNEIGFLFTF